MDRIAPRGLHKVFAPCAGTCIPWQLAHKITLYNAEALGRFDPQVFLVWALLVHEIDIIWRDAIDLLDRTLLSKIYFFWSSILILCPPFEHDQPLLMHCVPSSKSLRLPF